MSVLIKPLQQQIPWTKIKSETVGEETFMRAFLLSILLCLALTACGAKGPLYLPEKQYPQGNQ
ncbi:MAG TPA: lipoprotein [Methylophilaceae bacterium]|nr:lipoprotein [Methylophilaceae bacterium]HQR61002.1 lipoprotein [Methylophilaceae bacterium]